MHRTSKVETMGPIKKSQNKSINGAQVEKQRMEVGPGPDNIDHTREFEIYPIGNREPLKVFEEASNMVQDQFRKITLVTASGVDLKGEPGDRGTRKWTFNPEEQ